MPRINKIDNHFFESSKLIRQSLSTLRSPIIKATELIIQTFKTGGKLLICGNGGSAAESQHFAGELTGRYLKERRALPAIAITTDTSALSAIGNDYDFSQVFSRQLQALANPGDVLFCISTSGNSPNVLTAANTATLLQVKIISLTSNRGKLRNISDISLVVPSLNTPLIQEVHLVVIHTICDLVESSLH